MTAELHATGDVVADGLRGATTSIEAVHRQIARRSFGATGTSGVPARPAHVAHDAIAAGVYACVRAGLTLGARGGALLAAVTADRWVTPERERAGALARSALNGAFGDALARRGNALAIEMAVRVDGEDVPLTAGALADAYPHATSRVAVFLHGLCESDLHWRPGNPEGYGARLHADLGYTPVLLRYNTGLRIAENGERLSRLLDALPGYWPVDVRDMVLIGHSMGGLVIRAACHAGVRDERPWVDSVRNAVYLGAPHGGASLEKGARLLATTLRRVPEARPLAAALDSRSAGIHDLGDGVIAEEHVPLRAGIRHHAVCATIGGESAAVVGHLLGDLLVRRGSATGRGSRTRPHLAFEPGDIHHVRGANHFDLLCHPGVYAQLHDWLTPVAGGPAKVRRPLRLLPRRTGADGRRGRR
jgi:hypothetical protein